MKNLKKWQIIVIILEILVLAVVLFFAIKYFILRNKDGQLSDRNSSVEEAADKTDNIAKDAHIAETPGMDQEKTSSDDVVSSDESSSEDAEGNADYSIGMDENVEIMDEYEIILPSGDGSAGM